MILVGTTAAIWLEQKTRWGALAQRAGARAGDGDGAFERAHHADEAPTYELISDYLVPIAVPLLLFRANLVAIFRETGTLLVAFHAASLGTVIGAIVAAMTLGDSVPELGPVCGVMTASYIGGGVNFFAVKEKP